MCKTTWIRTILTLVFLFAYQAMGAGKTAETFKVALVQDGPVTHEIIPIAILEGEIEALLGRDYDVVFDELESGDWTAQGVERVLGETLKRRDVDVVITLGLLGSAAAASAPNLPKPVVSMLVGDVRAQKFPRSGTSSGKSNFVYIDDSLSIQTELGLFHKYTGFKHVTVLADEAWLDAFPVLATLIRDTAGRLSAKVNIVPVGASGTNALSHIGPEVDAVYVTPLLRLSERELQVLTGGLIDRGILSFSSTGREEVEAGLLMTGSADADTVSLARRVAIVLQRIALGADAASVNVSFQRPPRLAFNLATAQAIDFAPTWDALQEADLIALAETEGEAIEFLEVLDTALAKNLALEAFRYEPEIARTDIRLARSPLLPQIGLGASSERIKAQQARVVDRAVNTTDVDLTLSQVIYSERAHANLAIAKKLARASDHRLQAQVLNTIESTAVNYFQLLRATAVREVRRQNLALTRENLALAEMRQQVGYSSRGDVLRWRSRIASERSALFDAQAFLEQAQSALGQAINQPFDKPVKAEVAGLGHVLDFVSSSDVQRYVNDPLNWQQLQAFYRDEATRNAPEIKASDAQIAALQRERRAKKREFYIPEIEFLATYGQSVSRSGAAASALNRHLDNDSWAFGIRATLPLMTGFSRRAGLSRTKHELRRAEAEHHALVEAIETRVSIAAQRAGGSHPAIELAEEAQQSAEQNLELVKEQYSKGAIGITGLIDAQDAALAAQLASAQARFRFLTDFAGLLRAAGDFSLFFDRASQADWLDRIQSFYSKTSSKYTTTR